MTMRYAPIRANETFGKWTITGRTKYKRTTILHEARCSCGRVGWPSRPNLLHRISTRCRSCGIARRNRQYFGAHKEPMGATQRRRRWYHRWYQIMQRCYNPRSPAWKWYGARGIRVHDDFHDFVRFCGYVMALPGWKRRDLSLDRIDNDGDYTPGNLRFATQREQVQNRRCAQ